MDALKTVCLRIDGNVPVLHQFVQQNVVTGMYQELKCVMTVIKMMEKDAKMIALVLNSTGIVLKETQHQLQYAHLFVETE